MIKTEKPALYTIFFKQKLKNRRNPIKSSRPIRILATKGAVCQFIIPTSTKVYSKGSMGYNFTKPEIIKTIPRKEHNVMRINFLIMIITVLIYFLCFKLVSANILNKFNSGADKNLFKKQIYGI